LTIQASQGYNTILSSWRFGAWAYPYGSAVTSGLGEYALRVIEGTAKKGELSDLYAAFGEYTPGASWNGSYDRDAWTGEESSNHVLLYMDTYVFGRGFLPVTKLQIPDSYKLITISD